MLTGLKNLKKDPIECEFFKSATKAIEIIRKGIAATAANDYGAINFYIDDNKKYRCIRYLWRVEQDEKIFDTQKEAKKWLTVNLNKIKKGE